MSKIKIKRKSVSLDMTAMCDMAFLLLTFFMLATKFKSPEPVEVDIPSATANDTLPDKGRIDILISKEGHVYFGLQEQRLRGEVLDNMAKGYDVTFTDDQKKKFVTGSLYGAPMADMPKVLEMTGPEFNKFPRKGIPLDSGKNELSQWLLSTRAAFQRLKAAKESEGETFKSPKVVIKADITTPYKVVKQVIETLTKQKINKFHLITTLEK